MSESPKLNKLYYYLLCSVSGYYYDAPDETKEFIKILRKFLLDELNSHNKGQPVYDPIFGCGSLPFYGYHLSWAKGKWEKSAEIVYNYYKATSIIDFIKTYELVFNEKILLDYRKAVEYIAYKLIKKETIELGLMPGVTKYFGLVPTQSVYDKLQEFADLYE